MEIVMVVGKTVARAKYLEHELVAFEFTDGTIMQIKQTSQAGALEVFCDADEIDAENKGVW